MSIDYEGPTFGWCARCENPTPACGPQGLCDEHFLGEYEPESAVDLKTAAAEETEADRDC